MKTIQQYIEQFDNHYDRMRGLISELDIYQYNEILSFNLYNRYNYYINVLKRYDSNQNNFKDIQYIKGDRSSINMVYNFMCGWLFEDLIARICLLDDFKNNNFYIDLNNHDRDRVIKTNTKNINSSPDFIVNKGMRTEFKIEVQTTNRNDVIKIKENKYKMAINKSSFILNGLPKAGELIILYPDTIKELGVYGEVFDGYKKGYSININDIPESIRIKKDNLINGLLKTFKKHIGD